MAHVCSHTVNAHTWYIYTNDASRRTMHVMCTHGKCTHGKSTHTMHESPGAWTYAHTLHVHTRCICTHMHHLFTFLLRVFVVIVIHSHCHRFQLRLRLQWYQCKHHLHLPLLAYPVSRSHAWFLCSEKNSRWLLVSSFWGHSEKSDWANISFSTDAMDGGKWE